MKYKLLLAYSRRKLAVTEWMVEHIMPYRWWTDWRGRTR